MQSFTQIPDRLNLTLMIGLSLSLLMGLGLSQTAAASDSDPKLGPSGGVSLSGDAGGTTSLLEAIAQSPRDQFGNACLGFGTATANHHLTVTEPRSNIMFQVESHDRRNQDTTLIIKGPNDFLLCGDDTSSTNPAARAIANQLPKGDYDIWVGSFDQKVRMSYTLTIQPKP